MLQKEISSTRSQKLDTSNLGLSTPVQFIKGVGPKLGALLESRGFRTVGDLIQFFPRAYEDRSTFKTIKDLQPGEKAQVEVQVISSRRIPLRSRRKMMLEVRTQDESGSLLSLKWFYFPQGMADRIKPGSRLRVSGVAKKHLASTEMLHPEISTLTSEQTEGPTQDFGRIVPIYSEIEGVPSRRLRSILAAALERFGHLIVDDLPEPIVAQFQLPTRGAAVRSLHFPPTPEGPDQPQSTLKLIQDLNSFSTPWQQRLIFEEFYKFQYLVLLRRLRTVREDTLAFDRAAIERHSETLKKLLPFQLTQGQNLALKSIFDDLSHPHPMSRLIQGDVGSGKTAVAYLAAAGVLGEGKQAALMAPTEILAEQHYLNSKRLFGEKLPVALLTGSTKEFDRRKILARLQMGEPLLLIGTHALIEDPVKFKSLNLVMIDEQHRFGVDQRRKLRDKGHHPHTLILTATPIPRTLALTAYGDLVASTIRELPPGRQPIQTRVVRDKDRATAITKIRDQLQLGRQAYFIYPLVNDSEAEGFTQLKSAVTEAEVLANEIFPGFRVGLLHGQMKADEKAFVMNEFKAGKIHILVSTTVVEVGVDVPNATVIAIEHAERFGLSQLHQLRGRVGRGTHQSYCFLFSRSFLQEKTEARLDVLESSSDGFVIAEADLEIRGPGEFLGTRQSGQLPFKLASLVRDQDWLIKARDAAIQLVKLDPELNRPEHRGLRRYYQQEGAEQAAILGTS